MLQRKPPMTLHAGPPILPFHFQTVERRKYEKFPLSGIIFPTHFTFKAQLTRGLNGKESHVQLIGETKKVRETFEENAVQRCANSRLTGCGERQVPLVALRLRFFSVDHLTQRV